MSTQQRRRYCSGTLDSEAAELVARRVGLPEQVYSGVSECDFPADNEDECEGCGHPIRPGSKVYWRSTSCEYYYEGSYYGSPACGTSWQAHPGTPQDWLERIGWCLDLEGRRRRKQRLIWVKRDAPKDDPDLHFCGHIIAREGGPSYRRDLARARKLAKETRAVKRELKKVGGA